jgi:hypothetical protein
MKNKKLVGVGGRGGGIVKSRSNGGIIKKKGGNGIMRYKSDKRID